MRWLPASKAWLGESSLQIEEQGRTGGSTIPSAIGASAVGQLGERTLGKPDHPSNHSESILGQSMGLLKLGFVVKHHPPWRDLKREMLLIMPPTQMNHLTEPSRSASAACISTPKPDSES